MEHLTNTEIEQRRNELQQAAEPLILYLSEKHHPHIIAIVTGTGAEILEGLISFNYDHENTPIPFDEIPINKPSVSKTAISADDWFSNEHGNVVKVLAVNDEWCMVAEEGKKKPYVLPTEFVLATFQP